MRMCKDEESTQCFGCHCLPCNIDSLSIAIRHTILSIDVRGNDHENTEREHVAFSRHMKFIELFSGGGDCMTCAWHLLAIERAKTCEFLWKKEFVSKLCRSKKFVCRIEASTRFLILIDD